MPTRMGGYLNGLIFLMFLLAIGYSNNLLLIFTVLLLGFNLMWLIQSHFHLYYLKPLHINISPGHANSPVQASFLWQSTPKPPWKWNFELESDQGDFGLQIFSEDSSKSEGEFTPKKRGLHQWNHLKVKTNKPFGLYQVWIYFPLHFKSIVYPTLFKSTEFNLSGQHLEGDINLHKKGEEDFLGLSAYQNDESRKISWKHYARTGELLIKEGEEKKAPYLELELHLPNELEKKEAYLSLLATQMVDCHRRGIPFSFKADHFSRAAASGTDHLQDCLKVLALC